MDGCCSHPGSSLGQRDCESVGGCRCAATLRLPRRRTGMRGSEACVSLVLLVSAGRLLPDQALLGLPLVL